MIRATTIGELRAAGYPDRTVKHELRSDLFTKLENGEAQFPDILGSTSPCFRDWSGASSPFAT
jgi:magnesium chelatase subunit I